MNADRPSRRNTVQSRHRPLPEIHLLFDHPPPRVSPDPEAMACLQEMAMDRLSPALKRLWDLIYRGRFDITNPIDRELVALTCHVELHRLRAYLHKMRQILAPLHEDFRFLIRDDADFF